MDIVAQSKARHGSGVVKAQHDLRQFLLFQTMKTLRDERGRWHCSGEFFSCDKHEASKLITSAKKMW